MTIQAGQPAPAFTLFDDEKQPVTLADAHRGGPVVLLFFPGAFTSVCTNELNTVNNDLDAYGTQTTILGISTDSPFSLSAFKQVHGFNFKLLSDHNGEVSRLYGAKYNNNFTPMKLDRISKRAAFVVDEKGLVQYAEVLENAGQMPDLNAIKKVVYSLAP